MIRAVLIACALMFGVASTAAQADVIEDRKAAMKTISKSAKPAFAMLKGQAKFDLAAAKDALRKIGDNAKLSEKLYPAGSGKGKTRALPKIWENKADFDAKMMKLKTDAYAAQNKITDLASLKANLPGVMKNCGGCHKDYRAKKKK